MTESVCVRERDRVSGRIREQVRESTIDDLYAIIYFFHSEICFSFEIVVSSPNYMPEELSLLLAMSQCSHV